MRASDLRERVSIERAMVARTSLGEREESWQDMGAAWASVSFESSRERIAHGRITEAQAATVTVRFGTDVRVGDRLRYRSDVLRVTGMQEVDRQWIELSCVRVSL